MRFTEPMASLIQVRVTRDEKRRLINFAHSKGQTLSDFLRETATEAVRKVR